MLRYGCLVTSALLSAAKESHSGHHLGVGYLTPGHSGIFNPATIAAVLLLTFH